MTITEHTLRLDDGRTLSWCELGVPASTRVLVANHGAGSSRLELAFHDSSARRSSACACIAPERPGYGLSSALHRGRTMAEWADDVVDVVDRRRRRRARPSWATRSAAHTHWQSPRRRASPVGSIASSSSPRGAPDQPRRRRSTPRSAERVDAVPWCEYEQWYRSGLDDILGLLAPADEALFADPDLVAAAGAIAGRGRPPGRARTGERRLGGVHAVGLRPRLDRRPGPHLARHRRPRRAGHPRPRPARADPLVAPAPAAR